MAKPDLFDEIISLLEREAESNVFTEVSPAVLEDFYTDFAPDTGSEAAPTAGKKTGEKADEAIPVPPDKRGNLAAMTLDELAAAAGACSLCPLHQGRNRVVFGEGNPNAELMFIGEGPGRDEDEQGRPFVGRAGQLLTRMIEAMRFKRPEVFIANVVKCRPPNNRNPEESEANACLPYLYRQIELIQPKVLVLLGAVPLKYLLKETGITRIHGQWREFLGIPTMPTFHPAYLLRNPPAKKDAWEDLKKVMKALGKKPPVRQKR